MRINSEAALPVEAAVRGIAGTMGMGGRQAAQRSKNVVIAVKWRGKVG